MQSDISFVITALIGTATTGGVVAYIAKKMLDNVLVVGQAALKHNLDIEIKKLEDQLKLKTSSEIVRLEHALDLERTKVQTEQQRQEGHRVALEAAVDTWSSQILDAVGGLRNRLVNILGDEGYEPLSPQYSRDRHPNWSIDHDYFMGSTLYYFGRFFWVVRQLELEFPPILFSRSVAARQQLLQHSRERQKCVERLSRKR